MAGPIAIPPPITKFMLFMSLPLVSSWETAPIIKGKTNVHVNLNNKAATINRITVGEPINNKILAINNPYPKNTNLLVLNRLETVAAITAPTIPKMVAIAKI